MKTKLKAGAAGWFRIEAVNPETGQRRLLADWFPNLITNNGLNLIGSSSAYMNCCQVGTGATAPANTDTTLQTYVAGTSTVISNTADASGTDPYYYYRRKVFQFPIGAVAGNMSEVGIGTTTTTGNLFSRALIVDGGGSPTTVSVLVTEQLEVTYELRFYAPASDVTGSNTVGGVSTSYTLRAADADAVGNGESVGVQASFSLPATVYGTGATLGAVTGVPSGGASSDNLGSNPVVDSYSSDSHERTATFPIATTDGNVTGGIVCMLFRTTFGSYQISFSPAIAKDATKTLDMDFVISWGRYVAP